MFGAATNENNTRMSILLRELKNRIMSSSNDDQKRVIHSIKLGIALVLVSLLYIINPAFKQVGENAMWAVMTVVVMFEFYAGATLGKGINRGIGTMVGGGMGCFIAILADKFGEIGKRVAIASSLFIFGCGVTYCRTIPSMKKRYDYGLMISILTFGLVAILGVHDADNILKLTLDRLGTIGMGFAVCVLVSLFVFPIWAGDQLHCSTAAKFEKLSISIQGCLDEYLRMGNEKGNQESSSGTDYIQSCMTVLNSKSNDESLGNTAKWEPWHGKFGINHPWEKYIKIGEQLGELASTILSLYHCIHSPKQPSPMQRQSLKEPFENFSLSIKWILKELGEGMDKMEQCQAEYTINPELESIKSNLELSKVLKDDEKLLAVATLKFLLLEMVEQIQKLAKPVEELGVSARFATKNITA